MVTSFTFRLRTKSAHRILRGHVPAGGFRRFCRVGATTSQPRRTSSRRLRCFWSVPGAYPPELVGTPIIVLAGLYAGPIEDGSDIAQPVRELATPLIDSSGPMPFTAIQSAFDPFFPKGMLRVLEIDVCGPTQRRTDFGALRSVGVEAVAAHYNGCLADGRRGEPGRARCQRVRSASEFHDRVRIERHPSENDVNIAWARNAWSSMSASSTGSSSTSRVSRGKEALCAPPTRRLSPPGDQNKFDPGNLFRMNLNVTPSA